MKKLICIALAVMLSASVLASCGKEQAQVSSTAVPVIESQVQEDESSVPAEPDVVSEEETTPAPTTTVKKTTTTKKKSEKTATLYCVSGSDVKTTDIEWSGDFLDPQFLIDELSRYTGVNMKCAEVFSGKGGFTVDFDDNSTLFGGDRYINDSPKFKFDDYDSTAWFILDSISQTLSKNNGGNVDVYFSYKGESFTLKTNPEVTIDAYSPYKGSKSYKG